MNDERESLLETFDVAAQRLAGRLVGLSDEEYRWEPAPGCWNIHQDATGAWAPDGTEPAPEPAPLTTIAWRTYHLGGQVLSGFADWVGNGEPPFSSHPNVPNTALEATAFLENHYARWRSGMAAFPVSRLWDPIGEVFGPYAQASAFDLMLHVLDEYVHHAAEIALLRDLYLRLGRP